jgi:hypothetical protein
VDSSSYKVVLCIAFGLAGLLALFASRDRGRNFFLLFIAALGLGYRTLPLTSELRVQPAEIALLLALFAFLGRSQAGRTRGQSPWLPTWLWVMLPFLALAWLIHPDNYRRWDVQLDECRNVALIVPTFLATRLVLSRPSNWRAVVLVFCATGTAVALMGLVEYAFPSVRNLLPGFVTNTEGMESEGGFVRASFSFYGGPIAVFVCIHSLPFLLVVWRWWTGALARLTAAAAGLVQLGALYISGYRSMWLLVGGMVALCALRTRSVLLIGLLLVGGFLAQEHISRGMQGRLHSLAKILEGAPEDSSGVRRKTRIQEAFRATLENPLGSGWASAGWVHSDFLQVAANLGVVPGLALLLGYLGTLARVVRRMRSRQLPAGQAVLGFPLFLSFLAAGQMLAIQGVEFHSFTILPVWLVWALADTWLSQTSPRPGIRPVVPVARRRGGPPSRLLARRFAVFRTSAAQPRGL